MFRWKPSLSVLVVVIASGLLVGCGKKNEQSAKNVGEAKGSQTPAMSACEKALADYLDALVANDYDKAVEFIDVEEMLEKNREGTARFSGPQDVEQMKETFRLMLARSAGEQQGKLTYEILASHPSGDTARVEAVVYRDGKEASRWMYDLTKRGEQWRLRGDAALRGLVRPGQGTTRAPSP